MQTQAISFDPADAAKLYRKYQEHRAYTPPTTYDREIERVAKLIAAGKKIVYGVGSIVAAGLGDDKLPKLAICRADAPTCFLNAWNGGGRMSITEWVRARAKIGTRFEFPTGTFPGMKSGTFRAMVPHIPPDIRPKRGLENYHVLYEAEWQPVVPKDPILMRRIGVSDLWIVLATWNLTPIERAVIASRSGMRF